MGLDIYFHRTSKNIPVERRKNETVTTRTFTNSKGEEIEENVSDIDIVQERTDEYYREIFADIYDKGIVKLENSSNYDEDYKALITELSEYVSYPHFVLNDIGAKYSYETHERTIEVMPIETLKAERDAIVKGFHAKYDAYFRKVNFIYAYFENNESMVAQYYAPCSIEDLDDIIAKCKQILATAKGDLENFEGEVTFDEDLAEELLPTQAGFFFGSTVYNKWYIYDIKYTIDQLTNFRDLMKKDDNNAYIIFSW